MDYRLRLKVGQRCEKGYIICLSKAGNIRPLMKSTEKPIGVAFETLRKGKIAIQCTENPSLWRMDDQDDAELKEVTMKYFTDSDVT